MDSDNTSKHIKVGLGFAFVNPLVGMAIAGIGTLFRPTKIGIDEEWNHTWGNDTIMLPWGINKTSVPACHYFVRC